MHSHHENCFFFSFFLTKSGKLNHSAFVRQVMGSKPINTAVLVLLYNTVSNWKSAQVEIYGLTANASLPLWSEHCTLQSGPRKIRIGLIFNLHSPMIFNIVCFNEIHFPAQFTSDPLATVKIHLRLMHHVKTSRRSY